MTTTPPTTSHPRVIDPFVLRLSRVRTHRLFLVFVGLIGLLTLIVGAAILVLDRRRPSFGEAMRSGFISLVSPTELISSPDQSLAFYLLALVTSIVAILLPIFLLGAYVFKLFVRDPIRWRETISIQDQPAVGAVLFFRFYNGTRTPLVGLSIRVLARITSPGPPILIENLPVELMQGAGLRRGPQRDWALALPAVPFTVGVPLSKVNGPILKATSVAAANRIDIQDHLDIAKTRVQFLIMITGTYAANGTTFVSINRYAPPSKDQLGAFQHVDVDFASSERKWKGWNNFDGLAPMFVFVYGSLVSAASLQSTLGRPLLDDESPTRAVIHNWRRSWNSAADHTSHPDRHYYDPTGAEYTGATVHLGIEEAAGSVCSGAVFAVTAQSLSLLDDRERNYVRRNVSASVLWASKPSGCIVYVYTPSENSLERCSVALAANAAVVRRSYLSGVEDAFDQMGPTDLSEFRQSTPLPPCPIVDLTFNH